MASWRLIPSTFMPPSGQMAFDQELFKGFQSGNPPILRFFFFERPTLTLGRLEVKGLNLPGFSYPYEIRPTGGRMVLHGENDLCYTIVASTSDPLVGGELLESYQKISGLLEVILRGVGREVGLSKERHSGTPTGHCFSAPSFAELTFRGKKVAGGAQAREGNTFLQQGGILLRVSPEWKNLFENKTENAMSGLNEDPSLPEISRIHLENSMVAGLEKMGITFEKRLATV